MEQSWKFCGTCFCLLTLVFVSQPAHGQDFRQRFLVQEFDEFYQLTDSDIKDLPNEAATHLARVEQLVANQNWDEAVETLRRVGENYGNRLIESGDPPDRSDGRLFTNVRDYCQRQFVQLPEEIRRLYRERVDAVADQWYQQGVETRDAELLQRIVTDMFCSSRGDDALMTLGDIELEKGHVNSARWCWERISPLTRFWDGRSPWYAVAGLDLDQRWENDRQQLEKANPKRAWLVYPDSDLPLADVRARLVLASILQGDSQRAQLELDLFRRLHPDSSGYLAGTDGNYYDTLHKLLLASRDWPAEAADDDWTTFAGAVERTKNLSSSFELLGPPTWKLRYADLRLKRTAAESIERRRGPEAQLMFHPIVVDDLVLIKNRDRIFARNATTGEPAFANEFDGEFYPRPPVTERTVRDEARGWLSEPRFTMTVHDGLLYARVGSQATTRPRELTDPRIKNKLVCLDLRSEGRLQWQYPANSGDPEFDGWAFEGPPVADADGVYVCLRRVDSQPEIYVACLEPGPGSARVRWRQRVCSANFPTGGRVNEFSHTMLTLSEGTLFLNTNLGAIAALRSRDGLVHWVYRYPRTKSVDLAAAPAHFYRDMNPCLYYRGLVIAAPRDSRQILALDAGSGQLVWRSEPIGDPRHLLGIGNGNLIATGSSVWWLNATTGKAEYVWPHPDNGGSERGFGRGLLAGNNIYWPTREKILVLDQRIDRRGDRKSFSKNAEFNLSAPNVNASGGNLIVGGTTLLIAGTDMLYGFRLDHNPHSAIPNPQSKSPNPQSKRE
ncbi:MAG TPA: hypothetical protein VMX74_03145 [Pirellulales bacterium]|nr:hypothetical protein [Pirellulales bacterium]